MSGPAADPVRPLVLLPTYNEIENLDRVLDAILAAQPTFTVLVIDDGSPDGTGAAADRRSEDDSRIQVLHRAGKEGLARAYLAGFRHALADPAGFTHVFEMDADLSHDPRDLGLLLDACLAGADLAVGSRYVTGGGTRGWPLRRRALSRGGGLYARTVLGVGIQDLTAGFVCFTRALLEALPLDELATSGYGFQIEIKYRTVQLGYRVVEVPITFTERQRGHSKMNTSIVLEALGLVWKLRRSPVVRRASASRRT